VHNDTVVVSDDRLDLLAEPANVAWARSTASRMSCRPRQTKAGE
jgi:hypothetical protein